MRKTVVLVGILTGAASLLTAVSPAYAQSKTAQNAKQSSGGAGKSSSSAQTRGQSSARNDDSSYKLSSQRINFIQKCIDSHSLAELDDAGVLEEIKAEIGRKMPLKPSVPFVKDGAARDELDRRNEKAGYIYDVQKKKWTTAREIMNQYIAYLFKQKDVLYEEAIADFNTENYDEAVKKLKKAVMLENTKAKFLLGFCFLKGYGEMKNREKAEAFFKDSIQSIRASAEKGNATDELFLAMSYAYGCGSAPDDREAVRWYKQAAEHGNAQAEYQLGQLYENGLDDLVPQNYREAVKWYQKAAEHGNAKAQFDLGLRYSAGDLVPQNDKESFKWFRKSAESGYSKAQFVIGMCYLVGEGVPENETEAAKWFRKAAAQGHKEAERELKRLE